MLEKAAYTLKAFGLGRQYRKNQYDDTKIKQIQFAKLKKLLKHCFENIKFYRELFEQANVRLDDIESIEDISKLPVVDKKLISERLWDVMNGELKNCRLSRTSGSTGQALCIISDLSSRVHNSAAVIRMRRAYGMRLFFDSIVTPLKTADRPAAKPQWTYLQGLYKTYYVNPYVCGERDKRTIKALRRTAVVGITPAVKSLALAMRDNILPRFKANAVITFGQVLDETSRGIMEEAFGREVYDLYACNEAGDVAWQCPVSGWYHINDENVIVEVLKNGRKAGEGEIGEVVLTNLNRYSMPFIRYKNGDLAMVSYERCRCGRKLSILKEIIGRNGDNVKLSDGNVILWNNIKSCMTDRRIRWFQIVQEDACVLNVKYVSDNPAENHNIEKLLRFRFKKLLEGKMDLFFTSVKEIPISKSGKQKLVVSNI